MTTLSKPGRKPGTPKTGGRQAGTPNRTTRRAREVVVEVIENNAERIQGWLDQISKTDGPREALRAYTALLEFAIPIMVGSRETQDESNKRRQTQMRTLGAIALGILLWQNAAPAQTNDIDTPVADNPDTGNTRTGVIQCLMP